MLTKLEVTEEEEKLDFEVHEAAMLRQIDDSSDVFSVVDDEKDNAPIMKDRKHATLWQQYLWYYEFMEIRKRHVLRISAINRGKSNLDAVLEQDWIDDLGLDKIKNTLGKALSKCGTEVGPIWTWLSEIKGLKSGLLPAQMIAHIDDIGNFDTIAKLWRFCGYAVFDGKAEPKKAFRAPHDDQTEKPKRHYNGRLKGACFNIAETFIRQQTPYYVDIYYAEKKRQRELHPVAICRICNINCLTKTKKVKDDKEAQIYSCPNNAKHAKNFSKDHIHFRAIRKMMKSFLKDLWLEWRTIEGLDIGEKWSE